MCDSPSNLIRVKSGEEPAATLHASKQLYINYLRYIREE